MEWATQLNFPSRQLRSSRKSQSREHRAKSSSATSRWINILQNSIVLQYVYAIMLIGYARVSTQDQNQTAQIASLELAGCELVFQKKTAGGRPKLHRLLTEC